MLQKNEEITLKIERLSSDLSGVAHAQGMAVFVPGTVPGDTALVRLVQVKKTYAFAKLLSLQEPGADRIPADCDAFLRCGGCVSRQLSYRAECAAKQQTVAEAFKRIGGVTMPGEPIMCGEPDGYRNKAQYPFSKEGTLGFFAPRSHRVVPLPCGACALQSAVFDTVIALTEAFVKRQGLSVYDEATGCGLMRHLYLRAAKDGRVMVVPVINGEKLPGVETYLANLQAALGDRLETLILNHHTAATNVVLGSRDTVVFGNGYLTDELCGVQVRLSPHTFYQVNHDMAERLYQKVADYAQPDGKTVLDLYCGAGTIALSMAARAKQIIGVEVVPQAVENAKENATGNGFTNARFLCGDAAQAARQLAQEGIRPDVVIVDPPRKGCDESVLRTIAHDFCPERLVYVSCDPATLARDVAFLHRHGYELKTYTPCDLFPRTAHVETVTLITRAW